MLKIKLIYFSFLILSSYFIGPVKASFDYNKAIKQLETLMGKIKSQLAGNVNFDYRYVVNAQNVIEFANAANGLLSEAQLEELKQLPEENCVLLENLISKYVSDFYLLARQAGIDTSASSGLTAPFVDLGRSLKERIAELKKIRLAYESRYCAYTQAEAGDDSNNGEMKMEIPDECPTVDIIIQLRARTRYITPKSHRMVIIKRKSYFIEELIAINAAKTLDQLIENADGILTAVQDDSLIEMARDNRKDFQETLQTFIDNFNGLFQKAGITNEDPPLQYLLDMMKKKED